MKKYFFVMIFLIAAQCFAQFDIPIMLWRSDTKYLNYNVNNSIGLSDAVNKIGALDGTLNITTPQTILSNLTIPKNVTLNFSNTGNVNIGGGDTLFVKGSIIAPIKTIFSGAGHVNLDSAKISEVYPEWWGISGTADNIAIQKAVNASNSVPIKFLSKTYMVADSIILKTGTHLIGTFEKFASSDTKGGTTFKLSNAANHAILYTPSSPANKFHDIIIEDITFDGNSAHNKNVALVRLNSVDVSKIEHCSFFNADSIALMLEDIYNDTNWIINCNFLEGYTGIWDGGANTTIRDCQFAHFTGYGIWGGAGAKYIYNPIVWHCSQGIYLQAERSIVSGGLIEYCGYVGILLQTAHYSKVIGVTLDNNNNVVKDVNGGGIRLYSTNYATVVGNTLYDDQATKTQNAFVIDSATCHYNVIVSNVFKNNKARLAGYLNNTTTYIDDSITVAPRANFGVLTLSDFLYGSHGYYILYPGNDGPGQGAFLGLTSYLGAPNSVLLQLNAANGLDFWIHDAGGWYNRITASQAGNFSMDGYILPGQKTVGSLGIDSIKMNATNDSVITFYHNGAKTTVKKSFLGSYWFLLLGLLLPFFRRRTNSS